MSDVSMMNVLHKVVPVCRAYAKHELPEIVWKWMFGFHPTYMNITSPESEIRIQKPAIANRNRNHAFKSFNMSSILQNALFRFSA